MDLGVGRRGGASARARPPAGQRGDDPRNLGAAGRALAARQALAHQPRPRVCPKKRQRDRLIRWAADHPDWLLGVADETWWSRTAQPALHAWAAGDQPLRLVAQAVAKDDPDPKAAAGYGLRLPALDELWLRFVEGRPVSAVTMRFLEWCCQEAGRRGQRALLLVWDNASWHISQAVQTWIRAHNRHVKQTGTGVRLIVCHLPTKSPWRNPIEAKWRHTKRRVVEPDRLLSTRELTERVCAALACAAHEPLTIPEQAA